MNDLNNHLFEQLERLNDEELSPEELDKEIRRANAMSKIANAITTNAAVTVQAVKYINHEGMTKEETPSFFRIEEKEPTNSDK